MLKKQFDKIIHNIFSYILLTISLICLMFYGTENAYALVPTEDNTQINEVEVDSEQTTSEAESSTSQQEDQSNHVTEPEQPKQSASSDVVYNETELADWVEQHNETGGLVRLGDVVTITSSIYAEAPITIDTGAFGLVFDGDMVSGNKNLQIIGEGVDVPVVNVFYIDLFFFMPQGWNERIISLNITATGKDGIGGTALMVSCGMDHPINLCEIRYQGYIRSYGKGAVGIKFTQNVEAYCFQVAVSGENSQAVSAPNGATLYYCRLSAEGSDGVVAKDPAIVLDTCVALPEPENIRNLKRSLEAEAINQLYLPIEQHETITMFDIFPFTEVKLPLSGGNGYEGVHCALPVKWNEDILDNIDTSKLGRNYVPGRLPPPFQGLGLDNINLTLIVEVRDPVKPCIQSISPNKDGDRTYFYFEFWDYYDRSDGKIILWRSDDEGKTWWDATWSEDIVWDGWSMDFYYQSLAQPVWFVIELVGVGDSNTVTISEKDGFVSGGTGGDRTGTDREGAKPAGSSSGSTPPNSTEPDDSNPSAESAAEDKNQDIDLAEDDKSNNGKYIDGESKKEVVKTPLKNSILMSGTVNKQPLWRSISAASPIIPLTKPHSVDNNPEVGEVHISGQTLEKNIKSEHIDYPLESDEAEILDSEQGVSAAALEFPLKTAVTFALFAAALCLVGLLCLRFYR